MTKIYRDGLDNKRKKAFIKLKPLADIGVLGGGTALMLQVNHRYSYDFDIFFKKNVLEDGFEKIKEIFDIKRKVTDTKKFKTITTKKDIQITLFYYPFKPIYSLVKTESLALFAVKDIAADKAYTMGRRPEWRDYVDLFYLLKQGYVSLGKIVNDAENKFGENFDEKLFLEQLVYYGDIKNFEVEFIKEKYFTEQVKKFLKLQVQKYIKGKLEK